jgi:hypothetical protein
MTSSNKYGLSLMLIGIFGAILCVPGVIFPVLEFYNQPDLSAVIFLSLLEGIGAFLLCYE